MMETVFYYFLGASVIMYYGIGINRLLTFKKDVKSFFTGAAKTLILTLTNIAINWVLIRFIFSPLNISEIFPVFAIIIFSFLSFLSQLVYKTGIMEITEDYAVPFLSIILALCEGYSFLSSIIIGFCCITAFYCFVLLIISLRHRFQLYNREEGFKPFSFILISLAVVFIAFYSCNCSWLKTAL